MNLSASQCSSSDCESGWTMYLDQSSPSKSQHHGFGRFVDGNHASVGEDDADEGLSMVSDASSGPPPHYCEEDEDCFDGLADKKNKKKKKGKGEGGSLRHSFLDDTASSPELNERMTKNEASTQHVLQFSQGSSATHFKGKSTLRKPFGFLHSSISNKSDSKETGGFQGRKWK